MSTSRLTVPAALLLAAALPGCADDGERVMLDDTPEPVRRTILDRTEGGEIQQIEREFKGDRLIYEVEFARGGEEWEIYVDEDGEYIGREDD